MNKREAHLKSQRSLDDKTEELRRRLNMAQHKNKIVEDLIEELRPTVVRKTITKP